MPIAGYLMQREIRERVKTPFQYFRKSYTSESKECWRRALQQQQQELGVSCDGALLQGADVVEHAIRRDEQAALRRRRRRNYSCCCWADAQPCRRLTTWGAGSSNFPTDCSRKFPTEDIMGAQMSILPPNSSKSCGHFFIFGRKFCDKKIYVSPTRRPLMMVPLLYSVRAESGQAAALY